MAGRKRKEYPKVVLKNVVRIFDEVTAETHKAYWQPRSAMATHLVCMRSAGWRTADYATLMTVSGFGICFAYERKEKFWLGWVPPPDAEGRIARATGFAVEWRTFEDPEWAWRFLKRMLNHRKPIRAPYDEELILAGYQEGTRKEDRRIFVLCDPFAHRGEWWPWQRFQGFFHSARGFSCVRHTRRIPKAPAREVAAEVMTNIVQWTHHHPLADNKDYGQVEWGLAGMAAYAADIDDPEVTPDQFAPGWLGGRAIYPQWTARRCTAVYLRGAAKEFPAAVGRHVRAAAKEYDNAYKAWGQWEKHLGREGKAPEGAWESPKHRKAGAVAIRKAVEHEKTAIIELAGALASLESSPS
ncbi:MAG TPA: hypothetical protein VMZ50_12385 [Phycisphaerae bacterium]|nr:hypothetical protein [Phycisphaerae bacterium]